MLKRERALFVTFHEFCKFFIFSHFIVKAHFRQNEKLLELCEKRVLLVLYFRLYDTSAKEFSKYLTVNGME